MKSPHESCLYIVDDDDDFRWNAASLFGCGPVQVVGYASAQAFLGDFNPSGPACAVVDLEIPDMDGLSIQERLQDIASWLPVVYTTDAVDLRPVTAVMRAGAWHVLEKPIDQKTLLETVCQALQVAVHFQGFARARSEIDSRMSSLSKREREILNLLINGHSSRQVALQFGTSRFTVEKQRARMMHKLHAKTLPELAMMYFIARRDGRNDYPPGFFWWSSDRDTRQTTAKNPAPLEKDSIMMSSGTG